MSAVTPRGNVVWLEVAPRLAPVAEVNRLVHVVERAGIEQSSALRSQSNSLRRLSQAVAADTRRLAGRQVAGDRKLRRRIGAGDAKLDARISKKLGQKRDELRAELVANRVAARRLGRRELWDQLAIVSTVPLLAYGRRGAPFHEHNLTIALSLAVWLLGDEITELFSGSPQTARDADIWSYLAPFGNLLAGWWLLGGRQHERLVTGFAEPEAFALAAAPSSAALLLASSADRGERFETYSASIDVAALVAPDHVADFSTFTDVPALATPAAVTFSRALPVSANPRLRSISASVADGILTITVTASARLDEVASPAPPATGPEPIVTALQMAWVVDTQER